MDCWPGTEQKRLLKILAAREQRFQLQSRLIAEYNCKLICFTLNIPGPRKDTPLYRKIHAVGRRVLQESLQRENLLIRYQCFCQQDTGPESYHCLQASSQRLKTLTIKIEEKHQLGRLFDLDVIERNGKALKRSTIGFHARRCILCDGDVQVCRRNNRHQITELTAHIQRMAEQYFAESKALNGKSR